MEELLRKLFYAIEQYEDAILVEDRQRAMDEIIFYKNMIKDYIEI